jgi:signal transduction histidine kinase
MIQRIGTSNSAGIQQDRTRLLVSEYRQDNQQETERWMRTLLGIEWMVLVVATLTIKILQTPVGLFESGFGLWAGMFLGLIAYGISCWVTHFRSSKVLSRHLIAVSQSLWIYVLIALAGGQIDPLPLAFISLLFLAWYRDWRVLATASLVLVIAHTLYNLNLWETTNHLETGSLAEWLQYLGWILFMNLSLAVFQARANRQVHRMSDRRAALELINEQMADRFTERTRLLDDAASQLQNEFENQRKSQSQNERIYDELVTASRRADVAEAATGALHNVGNVLNSINVSAHMLRTKLADSRLERLVQTSAILKEQEDQLYQFFHHDERGKHFPQLLEQLSATLFREREELQTELQSLLNNLEHVKQIVAAQQGIACTGSLTTAVQLDKLAEDAICINQNQLNRYEIEVVREYDELPLVLTDKNKVLQILVNLILNAQQALADADTPQKTIRVTTGYYRRSAMIKISDNGPGISHENLARVFNQGFTTKHDGHGLGLHSCATAAVELGGHLSAQSRGIGCGATFILELPFKKDSPCTT